MAADMAGSPRNQGEATVWKNGYANSEARPGLFSASGFLEH